MNAILYFSIDYLDYLSWSLSKVSVQYISSARKPVESLLNRPARVISSPAKFTLNVALMGRLIVLDFALRDRNDRSFFISLRFERHLQTLLLCRFEQQLWICSTHRTRHRE